MIKFIEKVKPLFLLPPVVIDGLLCVAAACLGFWESSLGKDEAFKYWNAYALYFSKEIIGGINAAILSLIFFRSKSYTDHVAKKKEEQAIIDGSVKVITTETKVNTNETKVDSTPPSNLPPIAS